MSCSDCICRYCLRFWQGRECPHGGCFDRNRHEAEERCRGGIFYPAEECEYFIEYEGQVIEECHKANIQVFQDGTRNCCMMINGSCEACLKELAEKAEGKVKE